MNVFAAVLKELMQEKAIDANALATHLEMSNPSVVYRWLKGKLSLLLTTAVKLADFFGCPLDFLFGRIDYYEIGKHKNCPPFGEQFRKVLDEQKMTQYRLLKDKVVSGGNLDSWLGKKQTPHIESIIKLANYLNVSMDYLVGREKI